MTTQETARRRRLAIHATYRGVRTDAVFEMDTATVKIKNGPLAGQTFKSPSGAGTAVVHAQNPYVHGDRNGWRFWTITANGEPLATVRQRERRKPSSEPPA